MTGLNVPFLPEVGYSRFLAKFGDTLHSVHYSLYDPVLQDARIEIDAVPLAPLVELLAQLESPRKYLLANGRFHPANLYSKREPVKSLVKKLEELLSKDVVDGIVFSDSYMLVALGQAAPSVARCLEAVPSVNFRITDVEQLDILFEVIDSTGFKAPGKLTLDRSLNRSPARLGESAESIKKRYPDTSIEVLVNEGCLNHCPFRATHEALIGSVNVFNQQAGYDTERLNRTLACIRVLSESPHRVLASPFIRPEDVDLLPRHIDVIKICGRTLGSTFLRQCIQAYVDRRFTGNLLDLLDAANWMKNDWMLDNSCFPADFYARTSSCDQLCSRCTFCERLFALAASPVPLRLEDMGKR